ncbi:hypothetical protein LS482_05320 [Sinomicrobium kalidii]|uniref:hypothetical protein n=1 Tax=Sinomicrobium kalidii TaxID=2900738 RepID=UPI001E4C09B7|nr:hypothetical protein [Sinomicrobium kalidii]UGU17291.1 hypothetical protein LS482_05320 [Sinomicrobium kalidii]
MTRLLNKPHLIFWFSIPFIMLFGFVNGHKTLDVNIHATYYVIGYEYLSVIIALLFGMIGLGYLIVQKANGKLTRWLTLAHLVSVFGGSALLWGISMLYRNNLSEFNLADMKYNQKLDAVLFITVLVIFFTQFVYPFNLIRAMFRKQKNRMI